MEAKRLERNILHLEELKKDAQVSQKKGLPFIMASVIIWTMILMIQFPAWNQVTKNLFTFMCSCFLMPLAYLFANVLRVEIFRKSKNPINKLGLLCTMNQMLYLVIVMWAYNQTPESMLMLYAIVFAAHLLPFSWVYDSRAYAFLAVIETAGALSISIFLGDVMMCTFMIVMEMLLCVLLSMENKELEMTRQNN